VGLTCRSAMIFFNMAITVVGLIRNRPGYSEAATKGKLTRSFGFLQVRFRPLTPGARENYFAFPADELKGAGVRRGFGSFPLPEGRFCCAFTPFCDIGTAIHAISDLYFAPGDTLAISGPCK
jgi:hypothetical protein